VGLGVGVGEGEASPPKVVVAALAVVVATLMFDAAVVVDVILDWLVGTVEVAALDWLVGTVEFSGLGWLVVVVTVVVIAADVVAGGDTPVIRGSYKALFMNFGNRNVNVVREP